MHDGRIGITGIRETENRAAYVLLTPEGEIIVDIDQPGAKKAEAPVKLREMQTEDGHILTEHRGFADPGKYRVVKLNPPEEENNIYLPNIQS